MKKGVIILGSSNSRGHTFKLASIVSGKTGFPIVDLKSKNIGEFDYEFNNQNDDFIPLISEIVNQYEVIVFATPVYWYAMSGIMKTFFDRISDCLKIEKEIGRKFRGMEMAVITTASGSELVEGFLMPFKESANYLGMRYTSNVHGWVENDEVPVEVELKLQEFSTKVQ